MSNQAREAGDSGGGLPMVTMNLQALSPVSRAQGLMVYVLQLTPQAVCFRLLRRLVEGCK